MDLRVTKTRKSIREAFLKLRAENPLEKVRVTGLCDLAMINKTTFYKHYQDIYALSEELENETIAAIMDSFEDMNSLFTNPEAFMKGLYFAFMKHEDLVLVLFSGIMDSLINKVEKTLIDQYPWIRGNPEKEIILSFLIRGSSHVLMESRYEESVLLDTLAKASKQIIKIIDVNGNQTD